MVSVIIPAFEEEKTIRQVIESAWGHPLLDEIIVIDDGSQDRTFEEASKTSAKVIRLKENLGKAGAMAYGVSRARFSTILFLDADILGVTHEMITKIVEPVLNGKYEMFVALRAKKIFWLNKILHFLPIIGGERALTRRLWESVPEIYKHRFQIEIALNYFAKKTPLGMGFGLFGGLIHIIKEEKYGLFLGFWRRLFLNKDVILVSIELYIFYTLEMYLRGLLRSGQMLWEEITKENIEK